MCVCKFMFKVKKPLNEYAIVRYAIEDENTPEPIETGVYLKDVVIKDEIGGGNFGIIIQCTSVFTIITRKSL